MINYYIRRFVYSHIANNGVCATTPHAVMQALQLLYEDSYYTTVFSFLAAVYSIPENEVLHMISLSNI